MGLLRNNTTKREEVRNKTKNLFSELLDCEEDYAYALIEWFLEKTKTNKKNFEEIKLRDQIKALKGKDDPASKKLRLETYAKINSIAPKNHPTKIEKGDIVHVNYGQGYAAEISDGHYGVVINKKGSNYLVAPLTKTAQPDGKNTMTLTNLGLPGKNNKTVQTGYINFGQVKFVHYRRLEKVKGLRTTVNVASELPDLLSKFNNHMNR